MNAVFLNKGCQVTLIYENLRLMVYGIDLLAADEYTAKLLDCAVNNVCGVISAMIAKDGFQKMTFDFWDAKTRYHANCLFTYQTTCLPWLSCMLPLPSYAQSNTVFTMREGCPVLLHYEDLVFACVKQETDTYLHAADEHTAKTLDCRVNNMCGHINHIFAKKGCQEICFEFCDANIGYASCCLFTYQTSCLPWIMAFLHPGKTML